MPDWGILMRESQERWKHEDDLINHRLTWLGVFQGILFAAYGLLATDLLSGSSKCENADGANQLQSVVDLIPWLGLLTSSLILIGVMGAGWAMIRIWDQYRLDQLGVSNQTTAIGWGCAVLLPVCFQVAWCVILQNCWAVVIAIALPVIILAFVTYDVVYNCLPNRRQRNFEQEQATTSHGEGTPNCNDACNTEDGDAS